MHPKHAAVGKQAEARDSNPQHAVRGLFYGFFREMHSGGDYTERCAGRMCLLLHVDRGGHTVPLPCQLSTLAEGTLAALEIRSFQNSSSMLVYVPRNFFPRSKLVSILRSLSSLSSYKIRFI